MRRVSAVKLKPSSMMCGSADNTARCRALPVADMEQRLWYSGRSPSSGRSARVCPTSTQRALAVGRAPVEALGRGDVGCAQAPRAAGCRRSAATVRLGQAPADRLATAGQQLAREGDPMRDHITALLFRHPVGQPDARLAAGQRQFAVWPAAGDILAALGDDSCGCLQRAALNGLMLFQGSRRSRCSAARGHRSGFRPRPLGEFRQAVLVLGVAQHGELQLFVVNGSDVFVTMMWCPSQVLEFSSSSRPASRPSRQHNQSCPPRNSA